MSGLNSLLHIWQTTLPNLQISKLFVKAVNLCVFANFIYLLPIAEETWGMSYYIILHDPSSYPEKLALLLNDLSIRPFWWLFYGGVLTLSLFGTFRSPSFAERLLLWFLFLNLVHGNPEVTNAGWHLLMQCLFLSTFLFNVSEQADTRVASLKRLLHNVAFYGIWFQIALLYLVAGTAKLLGASWLNGEALLLVLSLDEYSLPFLLNKLDYNYWFLMAGTWIAWVYQLSFMVFIWFRKSHRYFLPIGLLFHLGIAFILGIADFGIIMIVLYLIFLPESKASFINHVLERWLFRIKMAGMSSIKGNGD